MIVIGIDPGNSGGIAVIPGPEREWETPWAEQIPLCGKEIDGHQLAERLQDIGPGIVIIEKAQAMPGQGVTSMFNYGRGFGLILGVLEGLGIPYRLVTPQAWKNRVLAGTPKDKSAAANYVRKAYPTINLTPGKKQKPHDGMADAACIADYGWRVQRGEA